MHPLILASFLKHCYKSPGSAKCLRLLIKPSFFSSFPPSMLYPLSRKQGKGPTVTKILTAVTLLVTACAYAVNKKQRNLCWKLNHFLLTVLWPGWSACLWYNIQMIWYCFDSMPGFILPLEQELAGPYFQIISGHHLICTLYGKSVKWHQRWIAWSWGQCPEQQGT